MGTMDCFLAGCWETSWSPATVNVYNGESGESLKGEVMCSGRGSLLDDFKKPISTSSAFVGKISPSGSIGPIA